MVYPFDDIYNKFNMIKFRYNKDHNHIVTNIALCLFIVHLTWSATVDLIIAKRPWCSLDVDICRAYHLYACEYVAGGVTAG